MIDIAALLRIAQMEKLDDIDEKYGLVAPDPPEDMNEIVNTDVFYMLDPGTERVCLVLRADGLTYAVIGEIMGIPEQEVKDILKTVRLKVEQNRRTP